MSCAVCSPGATGFGVQAGALDGPAVFSMFNHAEVPLSHPFIEQLVGTMRRELLDQVPFWSAGNLERKLLHFRDYYNRDRVHASLGGGTPACKAADIRRRVISLSEYQRQSPCRGL